jgi:iron complex transport system substrate-binding protein
MRKIVLVSFVLILAVFSGMRLHLVFGAETRVVTGLDGVKIGIPAEAKKIACFYNPAYDKIVMLSKGSRIALMPQSGTPWAYKFYPELKGLPTTSFSTIPDVERLLKLNVDLVIYPKGHVNIEKVSQAGITAICPFNDKFVPTTMAEYTAEFRKQIFFFGEVLGGDARTRAEKYCRYLDETTTKISTITSKITEADKPKVYYGKMGDLYSTQGNNTIMRWYTELAGGIYLPKKLEKYFAEVNMEKIIAWDPDVILLGMNGSVDSVTNGAAIKTLRAGKAGKVYRVPAGIYYWDMTSCETALLPLFLGKKFHPTLFKDWGIVREMRKFYKEIYGIDVTDRDAQRILDGLPPV